MNASDKRRARRFPMTLPVMIKMEEAEDHQKEVQTFNVSSSGVYFEFASPLDVGTALEFVLTLPEQITKGNAVRIKCVGKIVRVDQGKSEEGSLGVAATIERYEFLREALKPAARERAVPRKIAARSAFPARESTHP